MNKLTQVCHDTLIHAQKGKSIYDYIIGLDVVSDGYTDQENDNNIIGAWQHHWGRRVSSSLKFNDIRKLNMVRLLQAYERLKAEGRLNEERKTAAVQGILGFVHQAFYFDPKYWTKAFKIAKKIDGSVRPFQRMYGYPVVQYIDFLFLQWSMLPARIGLWYCRQLLKKMRIRYFYLN